LPGTREDETRVSRQWQATVGRIAHDLNNMLVPALTLGALLVESLPHGEARNDASEILAATSRARELVQQLLALGAGDVQPTDHG
jgi:hypothetical protein